jgi:hypothetical protein
MNPEPERPVNERDEHIEHPAKLLRITQMVRGLLEEVRRAPLDESGRTQMRAIHQKTLDQLKDALSAELHHELETFVMPLDQTPTESEIRVAQSQLAGWLEGLIHGIQAALLAQHAEAQARHQELHAVVPARALEERNGGPPAGQYP